jgi:alkyldihydroxyacetonephosphate synthase
MPDAVIRPESEEEVLQLLRFASEEKIAVIPVGGRTNVTSALVCPAKEVDPRPFIALDMKGLAKVRWVRKEDNVAMIEAGITGMALKEALREEGVNMGMEPDSMEFSTLGGWIATRASGMKRARYGNIEDMVVEVRVATPEGILWQHHGETTSTGESSSAFGRVSTNSWLPGLILGSEGCLGVVVAAVVRVRPLPEVVEYQSIVFPCWEQGASFMQSVAKLPAALRPASCRLMDKKQLQLASALKDDPSKGHLRKVVQQAYLQLRGIALENAAAATLVFEGSQDEVWIQKRSLNRLLKSSGGLWGGASSGEAGYALTFAIAYLRDIALDYQILSESLETMAPWSAIHNVWPAVVAAVEAEHSKLRLPGKPFLSCRMTQLYDEGGVLYMYLAICTRGLSAGKALEAFHSLELVARKAVLREGGCLSHHHGIGKHRAAMLGTTQAPGTTMAMRGLKAAMDPKNVLGACNGPWMQDGTDILPSAVESTADGVH